MKTLVWTFNQEKALEGAFSVIVKTLWTLVDVVVSGLSVCCELPSVDREGDHWCTLGTGPGTATGHAALNGLAEHCSGRERGCYNITVSWPRHGHTVALILPTSSAFTPRRHRTLSWQLSHICVIGAFTAELNR